MTGRAVAGLGAAGVDDGLVDGDLVFLLWRTGFIMVGRHIAGCGVSTGRK